MLIDDRLTKVFDLEPIEGELISQGKVIPPKDNPIETDYDNARTNLYTLLSQGEEALFSALNVAKQSESARAFEVVGNLIKQLADINHQLVELHTKHRAVTVKTEDTTKVITNNNLFCGTTNDLMKLIQDMKTTEV